MRLPITKVYRAFPELDRFTNEQCERLLLRARMRSASQQAEGCVTTTLIVIGSVMFMGVLASILWGAMEGTAVHRFIRRSGWLDDGLYLILTALIIGAGVIGLLVRDRFLRRILREQIERTTCPKCHASLLGSERSANSVRCGGCGGVFRFAELYLWSEDLGPSLIVMGPETACRGCRYLIGGLPIRRGFVTCPECGERTAVVQDGEPGKEA